MSSGREGYLRDLPHPNLNEVLKSNTQSAIKLLKTGKLVKNSKWNICMLIDGNCSLSSFVLIDCLF